MQLECYEYMDDGWPAWVKARVIDADGTTWHFADKAPMFFDDEPPASTLMPVTTSGRCQILRTQLDGRGHEIVVVRTEAKAIEDDTSEFRVRPDQILGRGDV